MRQNVHGKDRNQSYSHPSHSCDRKRRQYEQERGHDVNHPRTICDMLFTISHLISKSSSLTRSRNETSNIKQFYRNLTLSILAKSVERSTAGLHIFGSTRTIRHVIGNARIRFDGCERIVSNLEMTVWRGNWPTLAAPSVTALKNVDLPADGFPTHPTISSQPGIMGRDFV